MLDKPSRSYKSFKLLKDSSQGYMYVVTVWDKNNKVIAQQFAADMHSAENTYNEFLQRDHKQVSIHNAITGFAIKTTTKYYNLNQLKDANPLFFSKETMRFYNANGKQKFYIEDSKLYVSYYPPFSKTRSVAVYDIDPNNLKLAPAKK